MKHIFKSPLFYLNALLFTFLALIVLNANAERLHLPQIVKHALAAVVQITGTGTQGKLAAFAQTANQIGDSQIFDNGTNVGIGNTSPGAKLDVSGTIHGDIHNLFYTRSAGNAAAPLQIDTGTVTASCDSGGYLIGIVTASCAGDAISVAGNLEWFNDNGNNSATIGCDQGGNSLYDGGYIKIMCLDTR